MRRYKIAIVGAGPSGYFSAQALQNLETDELKFSIDLIERLPTPWGLVRSGVAPDHPKIKTVSKVFEKIATAGNVRLFGNVELGKDISLNDLKQNYDAVILATGSAKGKVLGIPGEELPNSISAAEFVPWYNGHPDYKDFNPDLSGTTAIVIGAGNVAMDVGRMLAVEPTDLDTTDTAAHAIAALKKSNIRKVYISARRSAEFAAFTAPEIRELPHLKHTNVIIHKEDIDGALQRVGDGAEKDVKSNLDAMGVIAANSDFPHERSLEFLFQHTPKEIIGNGKVEGVVFSTPNGEITIPCSLVVTAIGYTPIPLDNVPLEAGKVLNAEGHVSDNVYVVGWAKRGPSGVIGTNKSDAAAVMEKLVASLGEAKDSPDISTLISHQIIVDQSTWEKINAAEVAAGEPLGKPREKAVDIAELLRLGGL